MCCWRPCVTGPAVFRSPPASDGLGIELPSIRKVTGLVRRDRDVFPPRLQQLRDRMYKKQGNHGGSAFSDAGIQSLRRIHDADDGHWCFEKPQL